MTRQRTEGLAMAKIELPRYLIARRFKKGVSYYWMPPKKLLDKFELVAMRLAEADGQLSTAIAEAEVYNRQLDALRDGDAAVPARKTKGTLPWLYDEFQRSTKYTHIAPRTQGFYDENFRVIEAWSKKANHPPVSALTRQLCLAFYELLCKPDPITEEVMLTRAIHVMKTLRRVLKHGEDIGALTINPATKMELVTPPPRQQIWTDAQVQAYIDAANAAQRRSLALAVRLAADLGPRRGDVIRLPPTAYSGGVFTFRPRKNRRQKEGKLGRIVQVRALPELQDMMEFARRPANDNTVPTTIIVNERTGLPYTEEQFSRDFREIADACGGLVWTDGTPLLFKDLRRTAVINLARAGCTVPEIAAITGHSKATINEILETYLPTDQVVADNAVAKLEAYRGRGTKPAQS